MAKHRVPYSFFMPILLMKAVGYNVLDTARGQTYVDAARVACALERHRLATGRLPERLESLVPTYLDRVPTDVADGHPLRYQSKPDGSYVLYSIGANLKDDHGTIGVVKVIDNEPVVRDELGDWVWLIPR